MRRLLILALLSSFAVRAQEASSPDEDGDEPEEAESESVDAAAPPPGIVYSADISDEELKQRWENDIESLGTISVGFADAGRMINAMQMPPSDAWVVQRPDVSWGAQETIESLAIAFRAVHEQFPSSVPGRLSHISGPDGGYMRPHRSHQSGRDADIGFFYKTDVVPRRGVPREKLI